MDKKSVKEEERKDRDFVIPLASAKSREKRDFRARFNARGRKSDEEVRLSFFVSLSLSPHRELRKYERHTVRV